MSYNTRNTRQGAQGQGVGRGSSQIMYHSQQNSRVGAQNPGRQGQQSPASPNNFNSQQQSSTPPFNTQTKPLSQSFTPSNAYEYQNQPAQNQPQAQPAAQQATGQFPTKPILKTELPTANDNEDGDVEMDGAAETPKRPWIKKKIPGFKVNKKIKRRRQNARLRKILQPKNAIMVLNELKSGVKFTFTEQTNALTQTLFIVNVEVDGKIHVGQGLSKPLAKQSAAENALKVLLLEKMTLAAAKQSDGSPNAGTMETDNAISGGGDMSDNMVEDSTDKLDGSGSSDEVPWGSLASFALFKLFTEWQSQGTHVPIAKQTPVPPPAVPAKTAPMKQLPENPTERHPVMLLSQMRPGVKFAEKSRDGTPPNVTFTLEVTVDGVTYEGLAKNKKDAKKEAAKAALAGTLGIIYPS